MIIYLYKEDRKKFDNTNYKKRRTKMDFKVRNEFPKNFLWGGATAANQ